MNGRLIIFGGVFRRLRYDNLTSAVKKILRGFRRDESARFIAFRSQWRYESEFCTPAEAHEKGGVEGERNVVQRRIREAHLPRLKTFEDFDFSQSPKVPATQIHELAQGGYLDRAEPVIFIGDSGTGKTHLLTGLCVAACRQKRRVRFATAAALVNELVEAKQQLQLRRVLSRKRPAELLITHKFNMLFDLSADIALRISLRTAFRQMG